MHPKNAKKGTHALDTRIPFSKITLGYLSYKVKFFLVLFLTALTLSSHAKADYLAEYLIFECKSDLGAFTAHSQIFRGGSSSMANYKLNYLYKHGSVIPTDYFPKIRTGTCLIKEPFGDQWRTVEWELTPMYPFSKEYNDYKLLNIWVDGQLWAKKLNPHYIKSMYFGFYEGRFTMNTIIDKEYRREKQTHFSEFKILPWTDRKIRGTDELGAYKSEEYIKNLEKFIPETMGHYDNFLRKKRAERKKIQQDEYNKALNNRKKLFPEEYSKEEK